ncbi:hypothetical protein M8C21_006467 [Ambrosia artemisiifolia]|uniref:DUF1421 domain-containing protein n=1 Tax=Ambrosia artemisiifolia TaxID=4212 RepID=A0AAD5C1U7_AMBAR|nr:hypothetical protein M8C21_006467 [Ambrosia artemisiifolia]
MASGSSKGFDFASDDNILCSYQDYTHQEQSNGSHLDSAISSNPTKQEFNKNRMARASVFPINDCDNQEVILMAVERSMKKHTDNVMRFLEGLSSRLSQLELYCYNLDKSIGQMRSDLTRDHEESDAKLKFLEKHLQEVHRSVQILRDKQELAETQKELAKLKIARKESSSSHNSQQNDERSSTPDTRKNETHGQQLALVPAPQPAPVPAPQPPMTQPQAYYLPPGSTQYPPQPPQVQSVPQYQQQWTPQVQPQPQPQPMMQPVSITSSPQIYPQYLPTKPPATPSPAPLPNSTPMQMTYSAMPPPGSNQPMTYSYGPPAQTAQPQLPPQAQQQQQHLKTGYGAQPGEGYVAGGPPNTYMVYDNASGRVQHPNQGGQYYPPNQQQGSVISGGGMMPRPSQQFMRGHPYSEVVDKLVSMGYRSDHVMSVIQRMDEAGQTIDFNSVLDQLNGHSSGRGWSG